MPATFVIASKQDWLGVALVFSIPIAFLIVILYVTTNFVILRMAKHVVMISILCYIGIIISFATIYMTLDIGFPGRMFNRTLQNIDGIYFSATTMTTAGFGDITPKDAAAQIFVMLEMLIGVGYNITILAVVSANISKRAIERRDEEERETAEFMKQMKEDIRAFVENLERAGPPKNLDQ